jgi:hypothetical protein
MSVYCSTTLNYTRGVDVAPLQVQILNGREAKDLSFEASGFSLLKHTSNVSDWYDQDHVREIHCPEVGELAKDILNCDQALAYEPLIRSPATAEKTEDYAPIEFVHSDYSEDYRVMVQDPDHAYSTFLGPLLAQHGMTQASLQNASRIAVIQFWRNIGDSKPDRPFALCDARTTPRDELRTFKVNEYGGLRLEFETLYAEAPEDPARNTWYTFPELQINEVIAFRTYDSAQEDAGLPFWTMHSAYLDPHVGDDAPKRESVEMRVLCVWD